MSEFLADIRFGLRLLRRSPVFALTVSLLLGIGIGANTLIFSVVDTLLLRPLPFKNAARLVRLIEVRATGFVTWDFPYVLYETLAANSSSVTDVLCQADIDAAFEDGASTERIRVNAVSKNFFSTLGIQAQRGRVLSAEDEKSGAMYAVLSYDFWRKRFARSGSVIGRTIRLNGRGFTVVGVLPRGVNGLTVDTSPDVRVPLAASRLLVQKPGLNLPDSWDLWQVQIFGRLRPGITLERADAEIEPLLRGAYEDATIRAYPPLAKLPRKNVFDSRLRLEPAGNGVSSLRAQFSQGLTLLMAFVGLLLLMACANVAGLLLGRAAGRSQEIGIRLALGANPWRVARQFLTESLVLAVFGGALGVLFTRVSMPLLIAALPPIRDRAAVVQPLSVNVQIDARVLGFAILASLLTALLCGISPAMRGAREDLAGSLRGTRTTTARGAARKILVAAQVAVCVLLLLGASLLVETFRHMRSMNAGFDRDHIVTFTIDPGLRGYKPEQAMLLSQRLLKKTRSLPGVVAAAIANRALMRGTGMKATFGVPGQRVRPNDFLNSSTNSVTPGYFDAMGMRILAGRDFTWSEDKQKPPSAIVNQAFARRFFPGQNALGKLFGYAGPDGLAAPGAQIVGVVSDAKYRSLREEIPPTVYSPAVSGFGLGFNLHLRTRGDPAALIAPVREALRSLDPALPFIEVNTMREEVETSLWQERLLAALSTTFGFFAAMLAGIGLYGALDFALKARIREIGVRAALGASPLRIVRLLSGEVLLVVIAGAAAGFAIYAASARWFLQGSIRQVLYGVAPWDPVALGSALLFAAAMVLLAAAPPIWRAVRIDPASALRHD